MPEHIEELKRIRAQINRANKLIGSWDSGKTTEGRRILEQEIKKLDQLIEKALPLERQD